MRLIELPCNVSLDLIEGDLVQPMSSKERQQVRFETRAIVELSAGRKLLLTSLAVAIKGRPALSGQQRSQVAPSHAAFARRA